LNERENTLEARTARSFLGDEGSPIREERVFHYFTTTNISTEWGEKREFQAQVVE